MEHTMEHKVKQRKTRENKETTNEKKVNASNNGEIDIVAHNLSNTLLNLHKSNPWIDTALKRTSTLVNATSSVSINSTFTLDTTESPLSDVPNACRVCIPGSRSGVGKFPKRLPFESV